MNDYTTTETISFLSFLFDVFDIDTDDNEIQLGIDDDGNNCIVGDWNKEELNDLQIFLENLLPDITLYFLDQVIQCEMCGNFIQTQPSNIWDYKHFHVFECSIECEECTLKNPTDYLQHLSESYMQNTPIDNFKIKDLETYGYTSISIEYGVYEYWSIENWMDFMSDAMIEEYFFQLENGQTKINIVVPLHTLNRLVNAIVQNTMEN